MVRVLAKHQGQVALFEDQGPVQQLAAQGPDDALTGAFICGVLGRVVMTLSPSALNTSAHAPAGRAVTPARCSLRVPCSVSTSTCSRFSSAVSTRKSQAMMA